MKVFYIDEGYLAELDLTRIRPLDKKYASVPCQAVQCILGGIQPVEALTETDNLHFGNKI